MAKLGAEQMNFYEFLGLLATAQYHQQRVKAQGVLANVKHLIYQYTILDCKMCVKNENSKVSQLYPWTIA